MFTASVKKRENIAEYLLYMWQIEDIIRAYGLDLEKIEKNLIDKYTSLSPQQRKELTEWYESLIDMMRREDKDKSGHLQLNENTLHDLEHLNRKLLNDPKFAAYSAEYYNTLPLIVELRAKSGNDRRDEIETCFNALYGMMLLKLQGKEISDNTLRAAKQISRLLARLSNYYKLDYNNELEFSE
ncbi:MAG: DUF4924 family protein [Candidatus Amulumruptor caecigallinarius]|nr:DUF4924 family protein [Candidatus Amulumruptor caecigallinarius]